MTSRAARHHLFTPDLIIGFQLRSFGRIRISILPLHIENFRFRPDKVFGRAVASDTPFHLERVFLKNNRHIIDLSVARRATDALGDMDTMVEIHVFRQFMNSFPFDRLIVAKTCSDRLQIRAVGPDLAVAVHAGLGRRHPGGCGRLDRLMTISAVNAVVAYVVLMTELHRLLNLQISPGEIRRPCDLRICEKRRSRQNNDRKHADLCYIIRTFIEDL